MICGSTSALPLSSGFRHRLKAKDFRPLSIERPFFCRCVERCARQLWSPAGSAPFCSSTVLFYCYAVVLLCSMQCASRSFNAHCSVSMLIVNGKTHAGSDRSAGGQQGCYVPWQQHCRGVRMQQAKAAPQAHNAPPQLQQRRTLSLAHRTWWTGGGLVE